MGTCGLCSPEIYKGAGEAKLPESSQTGLSQNFWHTIEKLPTKKMVGH
jgi:hypothetical protein